MADEKILVQLDGVMKPGGWTVVQCIETLLKAQAKMSRQITEIYGMLDSPTQEAQEEMRLWLLKPRLTLDKNPWAMYGDGIVYSFVVRAKSAREARTIAGHSKCNEGEDMGVNPWLCEKYSSCTPIDPDGEPEVIAS